MDAHDLRLFDADEATLAVKNATLFLVGKAGGLVKAATIVGRKKSTVARWVSKAADDMDWTIPAVCVAALENYCGTAAITGALAEMAGRSLGPGRAQRKRSLISSHRAFARAVREYEAAFDEAAEDDDFTPNEMADLALRLHKVNEEASRMHAITAADTAGALRGEDG